MTEYEIMLLTRSDIDDTARTAVVDRAQEAVNSHGGKWLKVHDWGRRKTAYPIEKLNEANYQVLDFDGTGETLDEAVRVLRITDGVLRVIATKRVPVYPEGAREKLDRITDSDLSSSYRDRDRKGKGGGRSGR